ncbi:hypothetical protein FHU30_000690 [Actinomadura rupiterrae]|nr:hypothetical protein [Actinomadura rupiterrae]
MIVSLGAFALVLVGIGVFLAWFSHKSRTLQLWGGPADERGEVRYRDPFVSARRSPGPRPAAERPAGQRRPDGSDRADADPDESTAVLVGSGTG